MEIASYDDQRGGNKGGRGGYDKSGKHGGGGHNSNVQYVPVSKNGAKPSKRKPPRLPPNLNRVGIGEQFSNNKSGSNGGAFNKSSNGSGKLSEESSIIRAKEFWGYLDK